jgi:hypothetical protein
MNCGALAEIILDMARGAAVPEEARRGVRRHIEACAPCAAEYARQRDLTMALQVLATEAQEWRAPAATEQRLLAAFAAQQGLEPAVVARPSANRWRYLLATAAVLTLAVWVIREAGKPAGSSEVPGNASAPIAPDSKFIASAGEEVKPQNASISPSTTVRPTNRGAASPRTASPRPAAAKASASAKATADKPSDKPAGRAATPVEFVRIPSAIGLPELESGTVLRMELPLAALPEYGLDIAPDAVGASVEADILVGQDGQPRAIRLIGRPEAVVQDPRSRQ